MKSKIILATSLLLGTGLMLVPSGEARKHAGEKYSIANREAILERKISAAYSANQLTLEESDNLHNKIKNIKDKEQKMKDKNGGKLSYANDTSLEKSLNEVSERLQKKMLEKRVQ